MEKKKKNKKELLQIKEDKLTNDKIILKDGSKGTKGTKGN